MADRIATYWADLLGVPSEDFSGRGLRVVTHKRKWKDNYAYLLVHEVLGVVSVSQSLVAPVRKAAATMDPATILQPASCPALPARPVASSAGPAFQGYAEADDFRPLPGEEICMLPGVRFSHLGSR